MRYGILVAALALLVAGAGAQEPDEQTRDWEEQDRRYYERMLEQQKQAEEQEEEEEKEGTPEERFVAEFLARAEELVKDQNYWSRSSDRYRVQTDDPNLDSKAVLELLDSFRSFFEEFWAGRIELEPYEQQSRVFLYDSFYKYNELLGFDARRMPVRPEGHYISVVNVMVVNTRSGTPASFADALVHEAAHQLVDQEVFSGTGRISTWLSEGLASYFGLTYRNRKGNFQAGRIGGKSTALLKGAPAGSSNEGSQRVKDLRSALKKLPADNAFLHELLDAVEPSKFYTGDLMLNYSGAWMVVHFLLHGEDGRYADGFTRYLQAEVSGRAGAEVLYEALGTTAGDLQDAFVTYVKKVKTG
jgi:hypothetical protein